jgi:wyosine [tRNA(Phe)-imidazoG37] synthetase (radical SAM superfamily)
VPEEKKMKKYKFKYIYGPVSSWRLGSSLGVDPLAQGAKICSFNCNYCQLGEKGIKTLDRKIYVSPEAVVDELKQLPDVRIDYITFSGTGEPTLAGNLGEMIKAIKEIRNEPLAILTNGSLLFQDEVKKELSKIDFVIVKLDACCDEVFEQINRPVPGLKFKDIVNGIKDFKKLYRGKLGIQIMFIADNKSCGSELAAILEDINPDEVQLNTPLRPSRVNPLSRQEMEELEKLFDKFNTKMVYRAEHREVIPLSDEDTIKRRGKI